MSILPEGVGAKILANKNKIFWSVLAILALSLSFLIGAQYGKKDAKAPIIIEKCSLP